MLRHYDITTLRHSPRRCDGLSSVGARPVWFRAFVTGACAREGPAKDSCNKLLFGTTGTGTTKAGLTELNRPTCNNLVLDLTEIILGKLDWTELTD